MGKKKAIFCDESIRFIFSFPALRQAREEVIGRRKFFVILRVFLPAAKNKR